MNKVKAYFWANLDHHIVNVELVNFRLFRSGMEMKEAWRTALAARAIDQIRLVIPGDSPHFNTIFNASWGWKTRQETNPRYYPEAYFTVLDTWPQGRNWKTDKYRLQNLDIADCSAFLNDEGRSLFEFLVSFLKIEQVSSSPIIPIVTR